MVGFFISISRKGFIIWAPPLRLTRTHISRLKSAGFDDAQAEALSEAQKESLTEILEDRISTRQDLKELEFSLKNDISRLDGELKVIKWMMGFVLAGIAALVLKSFFV